MADQLPPWDEYPYFFLPKETTFTMPGVPAPFQVADANPQRVAMVFGVPGGGAQVQISTAIQFVATLGFNVSNNNPPLVLLQKDVGPLVQVAWFMTGGAGAKLTVLEVLLSKWPTQ